MSNHSVWLISGSFITLSFNNVFDIINHKLKYKQLKRYGPPGRSLIFPELKCFKMSIESKKDMTIVSITVNKGNLELLVPVSSIIVNLIRHYHAKLKINVLNKQIDINYSGIIDAKVNMDIEILIPYDIERVEAHITHLSIPFYHSGCHNQWRIRSVETVDDFINYILSKTD